MKKVLFTTLVTAIALLFITEAHAQKKDIFYWPWGRTIELDTIVEQGGENYKIEFFTDGIFIRKNTIKITKVNNDIRTFTVWDLYYNGKPVKYQTFFKTKTSLTLHSLDDRFLKETIQLKDGGDFVFIVREDINIFNNVKVKKIKVSI